ncbi:hypothetical protein TCAL_06956 [Tigriopus californicus]|uniref:Dendritic cell-specific transmembrane protein-like domain-containing protein n=1 Tax=Tigriopus californicus TaxID=6832 RepID=A0A553PI63_TIGCA|nr:uncharacterized protein LOC131879983 [Tigriopus californicus]TRY77369.1 hypothetical protein TCAL_06956 [Tigriopus californicus]|eukprot:TCALIF_06956-PA protein Name:"Protein of unknown function" AED:0.01 eAED:0.01 QI:54/1/0.5/1/1/1/2/0/175
MKIQSIVSLVVFFDLIGHQIQGTLAQTDLEVDVLKDSSIPQTIEAEAPMEEVVEKLPMWYDDLIPEITEMDILRFCLCILLLLVIIGMIYKRACELRIYYQLIEDFQIKPSDFNRNNLLDNVDEDYRPILSMINDVEFNGEDFENVVQMYRQACQNRMRRGNVTNHPRQPERSHG